MAEIIVPPNSSDQDGMLRSSQNTGSIGSPHRPNTAAVVRFGVNHIYTASGLTGNGNGIIQTIDENGPRTTSQNILSLNGKPISTVPNTPLAATVVWDNTQINLYYFVPTTNGAFLEEACHREESDWIQGELGEALRREGVFPHLNSTISVWNNDEKISVFFTSSDDRDGEMTVAHHENGEWQVRSIKARR